MLLEPVFTAETAGWPRDFPVRNKTRIEKPESDRILTENTREPLIPMDLWNIVQDVRRHKRRAPKKMEEPNPFSGLAFCAGCGSPMVLRRASTMKKARFLAPKRDCHFPL